MQYCSGTARASVTRGVLLSTALFVLPTSSYGFEVWDPYRPPPLTCSNGWIGLTLGDGPTCLQVSGNATALISTDTATGNSYGYMATARAAVIDEASALTGAVGLRAYRSPYSSFSSTGVLAPDHGHIELTEAFGVIGRETQVRAGLLDATFDSLAARTDDFDWLTDIEPVGDLYGLSTVQRGGVGVQVLSDLTANNFSAAAGLEDLGLQANSDTALGYLRLQRDTDTEAKVTGMLGGLADGRIDDWSLEAFGTTKLGVLELLTVGTALSDGSWRASLSGRVTLGNVFAAAAAEKGNDEAELIGSVHFGDPKVGPSIGVGGRLYRSTAFTASQVELQGSILALENMQLKLSVGISDSGGPGYHTGPVQYGALNGVWQPSDAVQLSARYAANSLGGWVVSASAEQRF